MGRLLTFGRRDSLLPAMIGALCPAEDVLGLDVEDPLSSLNDAPAPRLLLLDLGQGSWQPLALIETVRRRHPECAIVATFAARHRERAAQALLAGADAVLPEPYTLAEFSALVLRHLRLVAAAPAPARERRPEPRERTTTEEAAASPPAEPSPGATGGTRAAAEIADLDALSVFVRGLAHEINNPLTTIRGFLQLLLHEDEEDPVKEETADAYRTMESESRRIAEVIQELEYFSGARRPARTLVDLPELVGSALKSLGLTHVEPVITGTERLLLADREQLSLALRHLFGYLMSSAPETPPRIRVAITRANGQVAITAAGRCAGSRSTLPEQLLIPLYAGRSSDPGRRRSLACVFGIARAHGGSLGVGREDGDVLVFKLTLPAQGAAEALQT